MPDAGPFLVDDIARRYGVSVGTVLAWISAGELRAVNVSRKAASKKPRWRITQAALDAFEQTRMATGAPQPSRQRRRKSHDVIEFYK